MSSQKKISPIRAEIVEANDERTIAALVLFDRRVRREFRGPRHLTDARAWVVQWDEYLAQEWDGVRGTTGAIMDLLILNLVRRGVQGSTITAAIKDTQLNVQ